MVWHKKSAEVIVEVETKTTYKIISKINQKIKTINKKKVEYKLRWKNKENKLFDKRVGKLL